MEDESAENVNTDLGAETNDEDVKLPGIFRLPRELRDIIYGYIIDPDLSPGFWGQYDGLSLSLTDLNFRESRFGQKSIHKAFSIVYTCRQLQGEFQYLLFDRCNVYIRFKNNRSRPKKNLHSFPFNLLHLCRNLRVTLPVRRRQRMPGQFRGARNKPIEEPFSIVHDWTSNRKATLVRSAFRSPTSPDADWVEDGTRDAQTPRLWSTVVAPSRSPPSTCQVRDYDLQELYPHRLWSDSLPPFENIPCHWLCVQLFRNLSEGHRLRRLEVEIHYVGAGEAPRFVHWDLRMGPRYRLPLLTRSDYGAYPYIELISGLRKVPQVRFLWLTNYDDDQWTRGYDGLLMEHYLRRHVEDSDEARSLVDCTQGEGDLDKVYPALPQPTATGAEPIEFESVSPLDLTNDQLSLFKCPNRRFRLFDDPNILIPPPLRENTYDAPDLLPWIMRGRGYNAGDADASEDSDVSSGGFGGDDDDDDLESDVYFGDSLSSDGWQPPGPEIPEGSGGAASPVVPLGLNNHDIDDMLGGIGSEAHVGALEGHYDQGTAQAPGESGDEESSRILQMFDSPDEEDARHGSPLSPLVFPVECLDLPDRPEMCATDSSSDEESDYDGYIPRYCLEMGRRRAGYSWVFDDLDDPLFTLPNISSKWLRAMMRW